MSGQFWLSLNFPEDIIVLHWEIQISVPGNRPVKWKSPNLKPTIGEG